MPNYLRKINCWIIQTCYRENSFDRNFTKIWSLYCGFLNIEFFQNSLALAHIVHRYYMYIFSIFKYRVVISSKKCFLVHVLFYNSTFKCIKVFIPAEWLPIDHCFKVKILIHVSKISSLIIYNFATLFELLGGRCQYSIDMC